MDKINNIGLSRLLTSVYDFEGFTEQEVWCRIAQKINIIIEHFNYLDKKIENEKENNKAKFDYLLGEGLSEQVAKYLLEKISDGTIGELINETLLKDINDKVDENIERVNEELNNKAKKRLIYYLSDYGKPNDETYDNTPAFKQAIEDLRKTGGKLIIDTGTWEFKTPCVIDEWLFGCEIVGMSRGITNNQSNENALKGNFGTILNYSGSGCMFTFNGKMNHCRIENLYALLQDGNEFMRFNYTFHKGIIKDISVLGGIGCLDFNTGTYVRIENFGYGSSDPNALYGIRIGKSETRYTTEFFYINNSSIDFGNLSEANCIDIYRMEGGFYIDKTDLCNTNGVGLKVENMLNASTNYFVIRDVNFTRTFTGIELYAKTGNIGGVFVDNVRYGLKCSSVDERIVKCYAESGKNVMIHHKNAYVRTYATPVPTYAAELLKMDWQSVFEINAGNTVSGGFTSPIKIGSDITRIYDYRIEYKGSKNLTLSELTTSGTGSGWKDYKIEIASMYPYFYLTPIVLVNFNQPFTYGVVKTEVVEGKLYVYVRISDDAPDTLRMNYQILN